METVIQIALMFFFIQFLVVTIIMAAALLLAQPEVPVFPLKSGLEALRRGCGFVIQLPSRVFRSVGRRVHSMRLRSVH